MSSQYNEKFDYNNILQRSLGTKYILISLHLIYVGVLLTSILFFLIIFFKNKLKA
jgi:hypothetical protein